jgi:hypothetical protein
VSYGSNQVDVSQCIASAVWEPSSQIESAPMRTRGLKAVFALLALNRKSNKRSDWDRVVLIFSSCVTVGLIAIYVYGKMTP